MDNAVHPDFDDDSFSIDVDDLEVGDNFTLTLPDVSARPYDDVTIQSHLVAKNASTSDHLLSNSGSLLKSVTETSSKSYNPSSLPPHGPLEGLFGAYHPRLPTSPAVPTASSTSSGHLPLTSHSSARRLNSGSRSSPTHSVLGVSALEDLTARTRSNVFPALYGELRECIERIHFDEFIQSLTSLPQRDSIRQGLWPPLSNLLKKRNRPSDIEKSHAEFCRSVLNPDEKVQYDPFSRLCNAIAGHVSPIANQDLVTQTSHPTRLMSSRDDCARSPDVVTVSLPFTQ